VALSLLLLLFKKEGFVELRHQSAKFINTLEAMGKFAVLFQY